MDANNRAEARRAGGSASDEFLENLEHGEGGGLPFLAVFRKVEKLSRAVFGAFRTPKVAQHARRLAGEAMTCLAG
jgi:hypothetical protein